MGGFWDGIKFWWFLLRLKARKKQALWESNIDKYYFETRMKEFLEYNDDEDRKFLKNESFKPDESRDKLKIMEIEQKIGDSKAIKAAHRKNENFRGDIRTYIEMLENFNDETKT